jgi:hypothetical protein
VTDSNGNFCWVNEDEQQTSHEPPNLTELKEMFQKLRKEYIKKMNQPQTGLRPIQSEPVRQPAQRQTFLSPEGTAQKSGKNSVQSPGTFELTTTEPRQTYEHSRAKLDPRQTLFESKENTNKDLIDEFAELESAEEDLEEEESKGEDSQDLMRPQKSLYDSNYHMFKQLQKELNDVRAMYSELEAENKSLKGTNNRLSQEKDNLIKKRDSRESLEERPADSPRFNMMREESSNKDTFVNTGSGLAEELKAIKMLLQENLKIQSENLEKQRKAADEQHNLRKAQSSAQSQAPNIQKFNPLANPYRLPSSEDLRSSSDNHPSNSRNEPRALLEDKRPPRRMDTSKDKPSSSQKLKDSKEERHWLQHSLKKPRKRSKATSDSNSIGQSHTAKQGKLSSLGFILFRKWKDILGLEWSVVQQSAARLEKERVVLRHRKSAVQKYEWDMLWSMKEGTNDQTSKKILEDIKHVIFDYELDAEKVSLLTSLLESRLKKLKIIERTLDIGFKASKIDQFADDHLTQLFNQYIEVANQYEHKLRVNTSSLNPYKRSRFESVLQSSLNKTAGPLHSIQLANANKSLLGEARIKQSVLHPQFDSQMSHLDFLKFTMSKVREGNPIEGSVFSEISSFFEAQFSWFETISEEIKAVLKRLGNPTNISALRRR